MTDDRLERAWGVFDHLADVPAERRESALRDACGDDQSLRIEVDRLLALDDRLTSASGEARAGFLRSPVRFSPRRTGPVPEPAPAPDGRPAPPGHFGRYRVMRQLGEGGMGAVYEAEQDSPRRPVALKVIRPGLLKPALLKRFAQEVEILGRLRHPGIAQIYEAGVAVDGQPFFAMEFIRGLPLDGYARHHRLGLRARVGLLTRVCDAVQHAHDRGVIHRDLKPANILVDESGQPKVLDFGVARVTDADLLTAAVLTQTGQLLGTPSYMSPEQVTADPDAIKSRSDVYALGVILFELVAHRPPYQLEHRPLVEAARLILEQEAPLVGSIHAELRGDVETIVARALEKDPARRYGSAADLAADLRRWLAHEPILARPPSTLYHLGKFARRHKALVGGVVATMAALVLGLVGMSVFAVGEARQRREAEHNAYRARLSAAAAALQNHDVLDAAHQLDAAPEGPRGWEWRHLHSRLDDSSAVIPLPAGTDGYLLAAPDRLRIGTWTYAGLRLTDPDGGEPTTVPIGPRRGRLDTATPTRRGLRVVAWTGSSTFDLLDEAGRVVCPVQIPEAKQPSPVFVSPDGTRLACPWFDGAKDRIAVFDATTGRRSAVCDRHPGGIRNLAFSPDGTRLASAGGDRTARLWDAATGEPLVVCRGHADKVLGVAFSADGSRLATTSSDGTVRQWDAATGREVEVPYDRHTGEVIAAAYSPDGRWIASSGTDQAIRVWRATGRQDVALLLGHTGGVIGLAFDPSGRRLASLSNNTWLRYAADDTVRIWDVDPSATLPALRGHAGPIYAVACSADGRRIASGGGDGTVRVWDARTGEPCATLTHPGGVWSLAFGPDGRWLATGTSADGRLRIWDVATSRLRKEIPVPAGNLFFVAASPDGRRVAATAFDSRDRQHHLHVFDARSGERLFSDLGWALAYSPDGRWLAITPSDDKRVHLLDARTHETTARFLGHEGGVFKVTFSPDGRRLASCSEDRTVRLWEISSGACRVLCGHTDEVQAVAFHPDGTRLASGGEDRTVWLWDLERGEEVARLQGHTSFVWSLAFSPDGGSLVSGSGDFTVRLWDTTPLKARYRMRREVPARRPDPRQDR